MAHTKRAEYAEATKRDLIGVARKLFAEHGYAGTSLDDVVTEAGVTKGALYHHFENKRELFAAVAEQVEADLTASLGHGSERDPWQAFVEGALRYLDAASTQTDVQRILLIDAPTVMGYERCKELQQRYGLGLTAKGLEVAMDAGAIKQQPVLPLATMVVEALSAGAMMIARANNKKKARAEVGRIAETMLDGLKS